ncbi:MAG: hypothetical protein AAGA96_13020, partial [Verrucomicrobiota bacterium]
QESRNEDGWQVEVKRARIEAAPESFSSIEVNDEAPSDFKESSGPDSLEIKRAPLPPVDLNPDGASSNEEHLPRLKQDSKKSEADAPVTAPASEIEGEDEISVIRSSIHPRKLSPGDVRQQSDHEEDSVEDSVVLAN